MFGFHGASGDFTCPVCKATVYNVMRIGFMLDSPLTLIEHYNESRLANVAKIVMLAEDLQFVCSPNCLELYSIISFADNQTNEDI